MNNFIEIETSEAEVSVAGITASPPTVTLVHEGKDGNNMRRSFVQQVPVRHADLASRVLSELHQGDQIQATVVNEWREDGCDTYLAGFTKVQDAELEAVISNGVNTIVQNDITQLVISPALNPRKSTTLKVR